MNHQERERYFRNQPHRVPLGFETYAGDKQFATTLARGIELLRCFTAEDTELSNAELAGRTGLPRPTVSRLTYTLTALGYLRQGARSGKYEPGSALISATYPLMAGLAIRQQARPLMNELADATGGHVSLGLRDRLNIVLVETSRSAMRIAQGGPMADVGLSLPIVGSAIGRAFLAGCDPLLRESLLNEVRIKAPDDWAAFEPGMRAALREYTRHGFCSVDGTLVEEVLAVGTCIPPARGGGEPMVFNCAFVRSALPAGRGASWLRSEIGPRLKAMVDRLRSEGVVAGLRRRG
jgi:DNA-binding IclR family transcriptional regulator